MSKQSLMLSAAMAALLAGPAYAATCTTVTATNPDCVTTATGTALTTGALDTGGLLETAQTTSNATANVGSIYVGVSPGAVAISRATFGAVTVNSNSYVYSAGRIGNTSAGTATGILVDVFAHPNASALSFTNVAGTTVTGAGIYMDTGSSLDLSGSGTGKHGIWLNDANGTGTYTGDITFLASSTQTIVGDTSQGITINSNATLAGNLTFGGTMTVEQTTNLSTTASSLYGLYSLGQINGNIVVPSGGSVVVSGEGAQGMLIDGTGVNGSITIGGTLTTASLSTTVATPTTTTNYSTNANIVYPEAGTALTIGANVTQGIGILGGTVSTQGAGPAVSIAPSTTVTVPTTIGVYTGYTANGTTYVETTDPGFSFVNRGTISAQPVNIASSTSSPVRSVVGMSLSGTSTTVYPILTGGIFNSGSLSASIGTTGSTASAVSATGLSIGAYTTLVDATYNTSTSSWVNADTLTGKIGGDLAALVNSSATGSGAISATVSGSRGGIAEAIAIAATANVPSLINSGTISATVTNSDATLDGSTNPVKAYAIVDQSGTLNSIYNSGTISAAASTLDNGNQITDAILLGDRLTGTTVRIDNLSTVSRSAAITGNISFGGGGTQILNILGTSGHSATVTGDVVFNGTGDQLWVGSYGSLSGTVVAGNGVAVDVAQNGALALANTTIPLYATTLTIHGGTTPSNGGALSLGVSNTLGASGSISATGNVLIENNANLGVAFNSFIPQGANSFVLINTHGTLTVNNLSAYDSAISKSTAACNGSNAPDCGGTRPFLFASAHLTTQTTSGGFNQLVLQVVPKTAAQLPLTAGSSGYQLFDLANAALGNDDVLGAAMVNGIRNAAQAQTAYNAFAPNVTGGSRAIAISITDQGTGVVGARLRMLSLYGKQEGGTTMWGQEFFQMIKDPGQGAVDPNTTFKTQSGFKDHGFGFGLGIDGGSPKYGWYGGAFTFYAGDVGELTRNSHTNQQWYILSGYTAWRGKGLFFDSKLDVGYGHVDGKRFITLQTSSTTSYTREADNKHAGTLVSGGFTTGAVFSYGATTLMPQLSVDGLLMREEGYTEAQPTGTVTTVGDGFDLKVQPYYAKSLRAFLGGGVRYDLDLWDFFLQPEAHTGFRYDLFNDPVKLKAAFAYADTTSGTAGPGTPFTMTGPDPSQLNYVLGGSLAATTDTWTLGLNFDFVRGTNGTIEQVGTINLLGRI